MPRKSSTSTLATKFQPELNSASSYLNIILGLLIVLVIGILVFNYFKKDVGTLGPAGQTSGTTGQTVKDVEVSNLPGKYTVKEDDTLFAVAEKYYSDGYLFSKLAEANKLVNPDILLVGQVLEIPEIDLATGVGGAQNQTTWGEKITGNTYTTVEDDWLSKIAGRAYGDPMVYQKIAEANNITDVNSLEVGITLKIPR